MTDQRWYHGGFPGLAVGDLLLPPAESGTNHTLSAYAAGLPHGHRRDVVYLARYQQHARAFAALYPDGALYAAEPIGPTEPDPDAPEDAVTCACARIVEVIRPRILVAHRNIDSWLRMLRASHA